jgi:hypothetical protein
VAELALTGLDGANPLALFAALGVLDAATARDPQARLAWRHTGVWQPLLSSSCDDYEALLAWLDSDRRAHLDEPAFSLEYDGKRDLKPPPDVFRSFVASLLADATPMKRRSLDWVSAFATGVGVDNNGNTKPTALHFTAGQQQFLQMVRALNESVTIDDLREALLGPWQYARPLPVMGWDATASRDYALRANDPSTDKKMGVPGADWLAIRGLVFFPTAPEGQRVVTTGCAGGWKTGSFQWSLWTVPLTAPVIRSWLAQDVSEIAEGKRLARGVAVAFRSGIKRSDQGGYGSFEPATVI